MATVDDITPPNGKVGNQAVIHGSGFRGSSSIVVKFGHAAGGNPTNAGNSDINIKVDVPDHSSSDGNPVVVQLFLNGSTTPVSGSTLTFTYKDVPIGAPPAPALDPVPSPILQGQAVTLTGSGFRNASVTANPVILLEQLSAIATLDPATPDTKMTFTAPNLQRGLTPNLGDLFYLQVQFSDYPTLVTAPNQTQYAG